MEVRNACKDRRWPHDPHRSKQRSQERYRGPAVQQRVADGQHLKVDVVGVSPVDALQQLASEAVDVKPRLVAQVQQGCPQEEAANTVSFWPFACHAKRGESPPCTCLCFGRATAVSVALMSARSGRSATAAAAASRHVLPLGIFPDSSEPYGAQCSQAPQNRMESFPRMLRFENGMFSIYFLLFIF